MRAGAWRIAIREADRRRGAKSGGPVPRPIQQGQARRLTLSDEASGPPSLEERRGGYHGGKVGPNPAPRTPRIHVPFRRYPLSQRGFLGILTPDRPRDIRAGGHTNKDVSRREFMEIPFSRFEISDELVKSALLCFPMLSAIYLFYVCSMATQELHFVIGRYLTTAIFAVCFFLVIAGVLSDPKVLAVGVIFLFPTLAFRNAISARWKKLLESGAVTKSNAKRND